MNNVFVDREKAIEALVLLTQKTQDLFHLMKVIFYAEKMHLERYGQSLFGDYFVHMEDGPVPSCAYDIVKQIRGDGAPYDQLISELDPRKIFFAKDKNTINPLRKPNLEILSESNIECLEKANDIYGSMNAIELWKLVKKEKAYQLSELNKPISSEAFIQGLEVDEITYNYLTQ